MIVKVYAWIPRSYIHLAEVAGKIKKGISIKTSNLFYENYVSFNINEYKDYKNISFVLDGDGLYSLSVKLPDKEIRKSSEKFSETAKKLMMDLLKELHKVTYIQIIDGILPLNYFTAVFSARGKILLPNKKIANNLTFYFNKEEAYMKDSFIYVIGKAGKGVEEIIDYYAFTSIMSHFFYDMMNTMEEYHNGTKEVIRLLEFEPDSKKINNAYLNLDLVKKDASESWAKIQQSIDCLYRKKKAFDSLKKNRIIDALGMRENFRKLEADKDYALSLWELLLNHLEYVDTAVEARVNYKNSVANTSSRWLRSINSGFILATILLGLFISNSGINSTCNLALIISSWLIIYEVINYLVMKKNS